MAFARTRLFSDALGLCVTVDVILPQRRDNAQNHKLPVLWLLHGAFGNHADWIRRTSIERYAAPFGLAVVMPSAQNSCYTDMAHGGKYYTFISEELPRKMRTLFNFSEKREDNFIAGLSMGGAGSMMIGLANPECYSAIGCLSAGAVNYKGSFHQGRRRELTIGDQPLKNSYLDVYGNAEKIVKESLPCPRIFHACGEDDFLLPCAQDTRDFFRAFPGNPFSYEYLSAPGAHTWEFWDAHIQDFIRFLNLPDVREQYK
ncbi:MAG: hypothetical protein IJB69_06740 [Clostridia bacterium]|nr:hypothetical protein [Clostridia bacterium]